METSPSVQQDRNRADYMEFQSSTSEAGEPGLLGTYTGLWQHHCEQISERAAVLQQRDWHSLET